MNVCEDGVELPAELALSVAHQPLHAVALGVSLRRCTRSLADVHRDDIGADRGGGDRQHTVATAQVEHRFAAREPLQ